MAAVGRARRPARARPHRRRPPACTAGRRRAVAAAPSSSSSPRSNSRARRSTRSAADARRRARRPGPARPRRHRGRSACSSARARHPRRHRLGLRGQRDGLPRHRRRRARLAVEGRRGDVLLQHDPAVARGESVIPPSIQSGLRARSGRAATAATSPCSPRARWRSCGCRRRALVAGDRGGAVPERHDGQDAPAARVRQARGLRPRGRGRAGDAPRRAHLTELNNPAVLACHLGRWPRARADE